MALGRTDEMELLLPLHEGWGEEPRWETFRNRLRRRTRADAAWLTTGPFGARLPAPLPDIAPERLRPNRVYAAAELEGTGAGDLRILRVSAGMGAVLAVASAAREFTAADGALLSALAPHLAIALEGLARQERLRARLDRAGAALARTGTGWISFDREARVTDCDALAAEAVRATTGAPPTPGQRLRTGDAEAARLLARHAAASHGPPRPVLLSATPRLEALLVPSATGMTALLRASGPIDAAALEALHGLTRSEARLAAALAEGESIAEAAARIGLTIETARNYSKRIYAKTGARGQGDLIRLLLGGTAALA